MISSAYPELLRLQTEACEALRRAGVDPGELAAETSIEHLRSTASKFAHEMHVAWMVGVAAGVESAVARLTDHAYPACTALWRACRAVKRDPADRGERA